MEKLYNFKDPNFVLIDKIIDDNKLIVLLPDLMDRLYMGDFMIFLNFNFFKLKNILQICR